MMSAPDLSPRHATCIIMSGSYVGQELAAELGPMPPAMMPIGHAKLYELQLEAFDPKEPVHLVLPEDYTLSKADKARLDAAGVNIIPLPEGLSVGTAIMYAINATELEDREVRILYGDTLFRALPEDSDVIVVASSMDDYSWADVDTKDGIVTRIHTEDAGYALGNRTVACGYFSLSSSAALVKAIIKRNGDFNSALLEYGEARPLHAITVEDWLDFGHIQTFFRSRRTVTTARAFNQLEARDLTVRKSSQTEIFKIGAEIHWFRNTPPEVQVYTSRVITSGEVNGVPFYETEYEYLLTLSELYVFGAIGKSVWGRITAACSDFLHACVGVQGPGSGDTALGRLTANAAPRLQKFAVETGFDIERPLEYGGRALPSLVGIAEHLRDIIDLESGRCESVMHGDFCFSNIFYNNRARRVRVIDPRGYVEPGVGSIYGDVRYDLAKLAHSVIGRYDQIIAGRYSCRPVLTGDAYIEFEEAAQGEWLRDGFRELSVDGMRIADDQIQAIMIGLFLAMLPLHGDRPDRQQAFIVNALRLFSERF